MGRAAGSGAKVKTKAGIDRRRGQHMSLEKKDVRLKISAEAHAELVAISDLREKDISEFASYLLERALLGEAHVAKLYADRVARWGISGKPGERPGITGKTRLRGV